MIHIKRFFVNIFDSYIPNKRDNLKNILIKLCFIISLITLIVSSFYIANYILEARLQKAVISNSQEIWYNNDSRDVEHSKAPSRVELMLKENPDFKGWIKLSNTQIDNPIFQSEDNQFYLNHNQKKEKSIYGALFFDCNNKITEEETDKNLVIFGHEMKNGSMFGELKKLRSLDFYKQNPTIEFSTLYKESVYKIYAVFVLNASAKDDGGRVYNIYRQNFGNKADFDNWTAEAYSRSLILTDVDVEMGDDIITLVTCSSDFENSRLVVMARGLREGEAPEVDTSKATVAANPKYPKIWYENKGIKYPF